ncbi:receptor-like protein EIX2 [Brachypodium distachyon]|uniref:receptor-like protein EIX2 n=1 Tax=Brachypodium distachyon TaxID=15368 RepID=UPI000234FA22|nr:receptor-like protein EIX2 [Brachypodium distachyon]|eukprot:XP_024316704.1 receptor-like protein EIX2 [Brachypodium distachyon]
MAGRRLLVGVQMIFAMSFLLFHRSCPAPASPTLPAGSLCIPLERDVLLDFKAGLTDPGNVLSSWRGADCCQWTGVVCSNRTTGGHVVTLQISGLYDSQAVGGEIRSSLLTLRHLKMLDLSLNDFGGQPIPEFIGALRSLTHLDLSYSDFSGQIPPHLGNLSNLLNLQLSNMADLYSPDLAWLSRLKKLQVLGMSEVDLSTAVDWVHALNMLPDLINVDLDSCGLRNSTIASPVHSNLTSLETLDLSFNPFNTSIGANNFILALTSLEELSLLSCGIHGPVHDALGNLTSLRKLSLQENLFVGKVPSTFKKLEKLQVFELSNNFISMDVIELLHLLPPDELLKLRFDNNKLTGSLPAWIGQFSSLTIIKLNHNELSGEIPIGIRELTNLRDLWLNSNNLHGTINEDHFTNLTTLQVLLISDNSLTVKVSHTWNTPFSLYSASFSSCILGPQFPAWLIQPTIETLDISNTSIHDIIPAEFWTSSYHATYLDLSRNRLVGMLPTFFQFAGLDVLDISSNQFSGPIPILPQNISYLDLSENNLSGPLHSHIGASMLEVLLLFSNSISGTIPCSLLQLPRLIFLDLSKNQLSGTLPNCPQGNKTSKITMLNLNSNSLSGAFPLFLQKCTKLQFLDLGYNKFSGSLPTWIGSKLPQLALLRLRSNMYSGDIPGQLTRMEWLQYLDIACNNISGSIPQSLGNLMAMTLTPSNTGGLSQIVNFAWPSLDMYFHAYTDSFVVDTKGQQLEYTTGITYMVFIDFSCNNLTGQIPQEIGMLVALKNLNLSWNGLSNMMPPSVGELSALESFDLSHNQLSGEIPTSLSALTSLTHLNLSYNNLTGTIPSGNQLRTLQDQASIYIGNVGLCGPPLTKSCLGIGITPLSQEEHEGMSDVVSFYLGMFIGFVVGLWIAFCGFLFMRRWRAGCFSFSDHIYDWFTCK